MTRLLHTIALALLCAAALPAAASARIVELGFTTPRPAASCPEDPCEVISQASGFQVQQGDKKNPYRVRGHGKIVAFSITLGKPTADQTRFFESAFGGPARVRLSVLREGTRRRYRLTGQSEEIALAPYFGSRPTFALRRPLTMRPGYVVAISVPTWAPAFSSRLPSNEAWRSSRAGDDCLDLNQRAAQERLASLRTYACFYRGARLLYTAHYVPDPKPTTPERESTRGDSTR